jgi:ADP-ribosylglycohydrolase
VGLYSVANWQRDLGADLDRLRAEPALAADTLVSLLEAHEYPAMKIPDYHAEVRARGLELLELPIVDGDVPTDPVAVAELVRAIDERVRARKRVVVHCAGGLGRSGTIGGCLLVRQGMTPDEALAALVAARSPKCPERQRQKDYVRAFARTPSRASRSRAAVLGAAIGDAMGHPTEFLSMAEIRAQYGDAGVSGFELWLERDGKRIAPYTDDTQMAEVVLRTLVESRAQGLDLDATMRRMGEGFVDWSRNPQGGHRAPGNACLRGCQALAQGVPWNEAGGAKDGGCGSVMRAYPFGLLLTDDEERAEAWAAEHSKLTHRDPIALAASAAMAVGMVRAMRDASVDEVLDGMVAAAERFSTKTADMMRQAIAEARDGIGPEVTLERNRAWAAHEAIAAAAYLFARHPDDPRAAILAGANTPGDSDSIATLAGALVGARCGIAALPESWIHEVERNEELTELAWQATLYASE